MSTAQVPNETTNIEGSKILVLIKNIFIQMADGLVGKFWMLRILLEYLPCLWNPIFIGFFGDLLKDTNGQLTKQGKIICITIFALGFLVAFLTSLKSHRDKLRSHAKEADLRAAKGNASLAQSILYAVKDIDQRRVTRMQGQVFSVNNHYTEEQKNIIQSLLAPKEQIQYILDKLRHCFAQITSLNESEIYVSAAVSIDNGKWSWITQVVGAGTATLDELLREDSSFKKVVNGRPYFYANSKQAATNERAYYRDERDRQSGTDGSIICWEVSTKVDKNRCIRLIISISTYGKQLVSPSILSEAEIEQIYEDKIRNRILAAFENELLANLLFYRIVQ